MKTNTIRLNTQVRATVLALLAPLALASCESRDDAAEAAPASAARLITYDVHVKQYTRAGFVDNSNLTSSMITTIYKSAPKEADFENSYDVNHIVHNPATGSWGYAENESAYWLQGYKYKFHAFAPGSTSGNKDAEGPASFNYGKLDYIPLMQVTGINDNVTGREIPFYDYVVADTTGDGDLPYQPVQLNFRHILSRLSVRAYTTLGLGETRMQSLALYVPSGNLRCEYNFETHAFAPIVFGSGTPDFQTPTLEGDPEARGYQRVVMPSAGGASLPLCAGMLDARQAEADGGAHEFKEGFLLAPSAQMRLFMDATYTMLGQTVTVERVPVAGITAIESGKHYRLIVKVGGEDGPAPILFAEAGLDDWEDSDN